MTETKRLVVFFDDRYTTIKDHISIVEKAGLRPVKAKSEEDLLQLMKKYKDDALFFLDMHIPHIPDMRAIQKPKIQTMKCTAFATAFYMAFVNITGSSVAWPGILTGPAIAEEAKVTLSLLKKKNLDVVTLNKDDKVSFGLRVNNFIQQMGATFVDEADSVDYLAKPDIVSVENEFPKDMKIANTVNEVARTYFDLSRGSPSLSTAALGFEASNNLGLDKAKSLFLASLLSGSVDAKARLDFLLSIKKGVSRIIGEDNLEDQIKWMESGKRSLGKKSPWDFIGTKDINDLARVFAVVDRLVS